MHSHCLKKLLAWESGFQLKMFYLFLYMYCALMDFILQTMHCHSDNLCWSCYNLFILIELFQRIPLNMVRPVKRRNSSVTYSKYLIEAIKYIRYVSEKNRKVLNFAYTLDFRDLPKWLSLFYIYTLQSWDIKK